MTTTTTIPTEHELVLRAVLAMLSQPVQFTPNDSPTVQILRGDCAAARTLIEKALQS